VVERSHERQMDRRTEHAKLRVFQKDEVVPVRNYAPGRKWILAPLPAKTGPLSCTVGTRDVLVWHGHADELLAAPYQRAFHSTSVHVTINQSNPIQAETPDGEMEVVQAETAEAPKEGSMGPIATPLSDEPGATGIVMHEVQMEESLMAGSPEP